MTKENRPHEEGGTRSARPVQHSTVIDAVYTYDSRDLQDMAHPYSGVDVPLPPPGSLVRIHLGKAHDLVSDGEMYAITQLSYGARRVQILGPNHNVDYVVRNLRRYLNHQAKADAQVAASAGDEYRKLWGESA